MPREDEPDYRYLLRNDDLKWFEDVNQQLQCCATPRARHERLLKEVESLMTRQNLEDLKLCALHSLMTQYGPVFHGDPVFSHRTDPGESRIVFTSFASRA
ncbi:hypothetical protein K469DRAFT_113575 [Zopfia rhizophila CBS 207.26]|uniref:Uncharacterized protein n=1 Tax=Zopfia rhizophila CBS 207.26 TaxID=1314779 RepID=A0A6A6E8I0_9PEZI|nr:hypothetical protein K469DRAFT_113575 [Zopfia rhizophila CBS 207.26]